MKANELRIGNLINFFEDSTIFKVTSIDETGFEVKNKKEETWIESYAFEPIQLTEEWLFRLGFNEKDDTYWYLQPTLENIHYRIIEFPKGYFIVSKGFINYNNEICAVKYVHQLQNLYFALTGEELTINT